MKTKYLIALLSTITFANALTIEEAVAFALQKNESVKMSELSYKQTQQQRKQSNAAFLPKLDGYYSYNDRNKVLSPAQQKTDATAGVSVSYNLFNGFKDMYGISSAKLKEQSAHLAYKAMQKDIKLLARTKYIAYLQAQKDKEVAQSSLKMLQKQYSDAKNYYLQGLIAQNELLEVEVELLNAKQGVNSAKKDLIVAKKALENTLGIEIKSTIKDIVAKTFTKELPQLQKGVLQREELLALKKIKQANIAKLKANNVSFLPRVDASISHNEYGSDWDLSSDNGVDSQNIATIQLSWNLYNGGSDLAQEKIDRYDVGKTSFEIAKLLKDIRLQLTQVWSEYMLSKDNLETAAKALQQASKNYEISQAKFYEGVMKSAELIDANYLLTRAKRNYHNALYQKQLMIYSLQRVANLK